MEVIPYHANVVARSEIDNTTVYIYRNYAVSEFDSLSQLAALSTAGTIVFAAAKPPIAKLANVLGRGPTYALSIACYCLSYVLMAASRRFGTYAAGTVLYSVGQSGTNLLNDIVIADITTARQRALGIGLSFWPFLITPWTWPSSSSASWAPSQMAAASAGAGASAC